MSLPALDLLESYTRWWRISATRAQAAMWGSRLVVHRRAGESVSAMVDRLAREVSTKVHSKSAIDSLDPHGVEAHNPVAAGDVIGPSTGRVESEAPPRAPLDPSADQPARRSRSL